MTSSPVEAHLRNLDVRGLSPSTILARRYQLRRLAGYLGVELGEDLLLANESDLDEWQVSIAHLSANYRGSAITHVREFYAFAHKRGYLTANPAAELVTPKVPPRLPHPISAVDLDTAIAFAPPRIRPMLVLAAYCGLRAVEIARLTREQIRDQSDKPMLVVIGKGNKQRAITLPARVLAELRTFGLPQEGPVFLRGDGQPGAVTPGRVSHLCGVHLHSLGISESLHSLRHFYGTSMYAETKDLVLVQRMMGHTNTTTTSGYVAFDQQAAQDAAEAVAGPADYQPKARLRAVPDAPLPAATPRPAPRDLQRDMGGLAGLGTLSGRELQVLRLVAEGLNNAKVAEALNLSPLTIKSHLDRVGRKVGVRNRAGLVAVALRAGLVA